ncbi:hypothetical protein J6590_067379 [Homalodisca vitripennis]|nr:hypothetical protein J6590_067379 [Homalodisca vitripennis]
MDSPVAGSTRMESGGERALRCYWESVVDSSMLRQRGTSSSQYRFGFSVLVTLDSTSTCHSIMTTPSATLYSPLSCLIHDSGYNFLIQ